MQPRIVLRPEQLRTVQALLHAHMQRHEVRAFGSRVTGNAKPTSDLDLCIMGEDAPSPVAVERLRMALSESALPFKVDIVVWAECGEAFRNIIRAQSIMVQRADEVSMT